MQASDEKVMDDMTTGVVGDDSGDSEVHSSDSSSEDKQDQSQMEVCDQVSFGTESEHDSQKDESQSSTSHSSSIDLDSFLGSGVAASPSFTFKIVGDNIDKEVKPQDMRSDYQTRSLHYFHSYAVRDRVNMDNFDDSVHTPDITAVDLEVLLPSKEDEADLYANMGILIARILKKYIPFFKEFGKGVERHIMHKYSEEMSRKSSVVSSAYNYIHNYIIALFTSPVMLTSLFVLYVD